MVLQKIPYQPGLQTKTKYTPPMNQENNDLDKAVFILGGMLINENG